jgi:hypothetical protein
MHKTYVIAAVPVFRALLLMLSRNSAVWVHLQIQKIVILGWTPVLLQSGSRACLPREGLGPPSWTECKILDWAPKLLELITLWCWKQTHKRQKLLTRQFSLNQESKSMCSLQLSKHASTKWLTVALPYIPDTVVPAPYLGFVQIKGHSLSRLAKRLGGWVRACSLAMKLYRNPEEEARTL